MELELGLALHPLPHHHHHHDVPKNDFGLSIKIEPEAVLKNVINNNNNVNGGCGLEFQNLVQSRKRSFAAAYDEEQISNQLSLFVWSGRQPNDGDDRLNITTFATAKKKKEEEDEEIVGWPPIRSWRRKLLRDINERAGNNIINVNGGVRNSIYVKVKMEGVAIGRKIDLMLFNSYQSLTNTLITMFAQYNNGAYTLSYLDKEGDWLLAGDVPWQIFIDSVQRMEISKQSS